MSDDPQYLLAPKRLRRYQNASKIGTRNWDHETPERDIGSYTHLAFNPLTEGFPWDDLRKILHGGQRICTELNWNEPNFIFYFISFTLVVIYMYWYCVLCIAAFWQLLIINEYQSINQSIGYHTKWRRNIAESFNILSRAHERCRR